MSCEGPDLLYLRVGDQFVPEAEPLILCAGGEHSLSLEYGAAGSIGAGTLPFHLRSLAEVGADIELVQHSFEVEDVHELTLRTGSAGSAHLYFYAEPGRAGFEDQHLERHVELEIRDCQ
jgi:hypothetical protein